MQGNTITVAWSGLPDYAARCLRALVAEREPGTVQVIGSRPEVPLDDVERTLGAKVHWVDPSDRTISWEALRLKPPRLFIQSGYSRPAFNQLGAQCRSRGGRAVMMSDHNWQGGLRQSVVDRLRHLVIYRRRFDAVFVPGRSGRRYHEEMGYAPTDIVEGVCGADPGLFNAQSPLSGRPRTLVYVGQLIERKNIRRLVRAFLTVWEHHPQWRLQIYGAGPIRDSLPHHPAIEINGFVQPTELARILTNVRALVLPSIEEHWGVVVHEAALAGCALALSDVIGAGPDLARDENAVFFPPADDAAIEAALVQLMNWPAAQWERAERTSRILARQFGPQQFVEAVGRLECVCNIDRSGAMG